ncbi:cytochrome c biogenesis protein ResB [Candidatus Sumerlaeota bacterium]|nr:cytochrome c biogenesis protein ResB [Candidatus Sumerlaeota bacterium]
MQDAEIVKKDTSSGGAVVGVIAALDRMILKGWRVFVSLKFGIFLLAAIGVASIYGTMSYASNAALGDNAIPMARSMYFESKWFVMLLLVFALNLILSTWHVTVMSFTIWWKRDFRRDSDYYTHGSGPRATVSVPGGATEVESVLRKKFTRVHRDGTAFFAQRGILSRLGPTIVHIGILTVIFSVVAKAFLIWEGKIMTEGRFLAAEGEMSPIVHQPLAIEQQITDANRIETPIDVWVKVLDFDEIKHPNSEVPAYFSSLVEVRDPRTQEVTVAQLDMNHSLKIPTSKFGVLEFHQAGYQKIEDGAMPPRYNFDVRDAQTGERIGIADGSKGDRVRVGDTKYMLEVDGESAGAGWRLYDMAAPEKVIGEGTLTAGEKTNFQVRPAEFFSDFQIDEKTNKPYNASNMLTNAALRVEILEDGKLTQSEVLFFDRQLSELTSTNHPAFKLALEDLKIPQNQDSASVDWNKPGAAMFSVRVSNVKNASESEVIDLFMGQSSHAFAFNKLEAPAPAAGSGYAVRLLGPTARYTTVLSVVNEPTVRYTALGVFITVFGALLTFAFRYRAFYGLWDEGAQTLRMALVPRWGQSPVKKEFDELVALLSHGGTIAAPENASTIDKETFAQVPDTANTIPTPVDAG